MTLRKPSGIARVAKVGREQLVGLVTAIERFVAGSGDADAAVEVAELRRAHALLQHGPLELEWVERSVLGSPALLVRLPPEQTTTFVLALRVQQPPVYVEEGDAWRGVLSVNSLGLTVGDGERVARACERASREIGLSVRVGGADGE